jgi:hypothetical protein
VAGFSSVSSSLNYENLELRLREYKRYVLSLSISAKDLNVLSPRE